MPAVKYPHWDNAVDVHTCSIQSWTEGKNILTCQGRQHQSKLDKKRTDQVIGVWSSNITTSITTARLRLFALAALPDNLFFPLTSWFIIPWRKLIFMYTLSSCTCNKQPQFDEWCEKEHFWDSKLITTRCQELHFNWWCKQGMFTVLEAN